MEYSHTGGHRRFMCVDIQRSFKDRRFNRHGWLSGENDTHVKLQLLAMTCEEHSAIGATNIAARVMIKVHMSPLCTSFTAPPQLKAP